MTLLCLQEKWQERSTDPSAALSLAPMPGSEDTTAQGAGKIELCSFWATRIKSAAGHLPMHILPFGLQLWQDS